MAASPGHPVRFEVDYPDRELNRLATRARPTGVHPLHNPEARGDLNRWLPLIKWLLAIPHSIVLAYVGYAFIMVTDAYPPFRLRA